MRSPESYIDRCVKAVEVINPYTLEQKGLGAEIGSSTNPEGFAMRSLGMLQFSDRFVHAGLKISKIPGANSVERRMEEELSGIDFLLARMPELKTLVPNFMAMVSIEGREPVAQLTEDASLGGQFSVASFNSQGVLTRLFEKSFKDDPDAKVDRLTIEDTLPFVVDGVELRFLDFTPPPVVDKGGQPERKQKIRDLLYDQRALTVDISADSPLGQALAPRLAD